jgi:hypothetical protein
MDGPKLPPGRCHGAILFKDAPFGEPGRIQHGHVACDTLQSLGRQYQRL